GLPVPGQALGHHRLGDILDPFHHVHEGLPVRRAARGKPHTTVTHHHRSHPVVGGLQQVLRPGHLAVVVGVDIHEPRGHQLAAGVDFRPAATGDAGCHGGDDTVADGHVGLGGGPATAVHHGAIADDQIVSVHGSVLLELSLGSTGYLPVKMAAP